MMLLYIFVNNSLFISMCILNDLPKEKTGPVRPMYVTSFGGLIWMIVAGPIDLE
jgi:hypothetical protein